MSHYSIKVEGLGKQYFIPQHRGSIAKVPLRDSLRNPLRTVQGLLGGGAPALRSFWALKSVDLIVNPGESLGVIGSNGAGKTTLLKILARITPPTEGVARIRGRLTPLLGVGAGFVKNLSGRGNIYLNSAIMGMSRREIDRRFDEIVDFAGVGRFIDMPVKHYSSGMYSRLAFSVAAHIITDILLVDEVLSVGDAAFQKKSLDKMSDLMGNGRTVVFVSHNMNSVLRFCQKVLWLEQGQVVMYGDAQEVASAYLSGVSKLRSVWKKPASSPSLPPPANGSQVPPAEEKTLTEEKVVDFHSFHLHDEQGVSKQIFRRSEDICVQLSYDLKKTSMRVIPIVHLTCAPRHGLDSNVHVLTSYDWKLEGGAAPGHYIAETRVPKGLLNDGDYYFSAAFVSPGGKLLRHVELDHALLCKVVDDTSPEKIIGSAHRGVIRPALQWSTRLVAPSIHATAS